MRLVIRLTLGVVLIAVGFNKFFGYAPVPDLAPDAAAFMGALAATGYMLPMIAVFEIVSGFLFLGAATAPLAAILMAPISVNILAFHVFLDLSTGGLGIIVALANLYLGIAYFGFYRSIFARILAEHVVITEKSGERTTRPIAVIN